MSKKHTPSFPRSCVGMQTETNPSQGMDSHAGAWEPDVTKKYLPKLRFPEFRDAGEWEETTIGDIGSFYYGKSAPKWSLEKDAPTRCVRYGELYTKFGAVITEIYSRTNIDPNKLRFSKGGEILVPRVGEKPEDFGKCCCYLPLENIAIGEMISVFETAQNPLFYTYYFRQLYREFAKVVEGQNVKNLYYAELEPLQIHNPTLPEQQKIANCLSSIDDLITAQAQKTEALKAHKKGLMQQLFPHEGETVPRLRFPEFRDTGEWEEKKLSTIAELTSSKRVHLSDYVPNGIPFFRGKEITSLRKREIPEDILYISEEHYAEIREKYGVPEVGDILITAVGTLGNVYQIKNSDKFYFKDGNLIWMKNISEDSRFLEILLDVKRSVVLDSAIGSSQKALTMVELNKLEFNFPKKEEQQKIANCLSSIDDLITAQAQKTEALKAHKKGLMQQLFPSLDKLGA